MVRTSNANFSRHENVNAATKQYLKLVPLLAVPLAIVLALLAEFCGNIHGSPACGPFSFVAVPITVLGLFIEHLLFSDPQSGFTVRLLIWFAACLIALLLSAAFLWFRSARRGK